MHLLPPRKKLRTYVHGGDYVSSGSPETFRWMQQKLEEGYQVKTQFLGPGEEFNQQLTILNRIVLWHEHKGIAYEADPRHAELVIDQLNLKEATIACTPGIREEGRTKETHEEMLSEKESTRYRAVIARCNYLAPDRPDIAYAVKEFARAMAKPNEGDMQRLKT